MPMTKDRCKALAGFLNSAEDLVHGDYENGFHESRCGHQFETLTKKQQLGVHHEFPLQQF